MSQPVHKLRDGILQVCIWQNFSPEKNSTYYKATVQRSRNIGDDVWEDGDSFFENDLLALAELLREAKAWIRNRKRADAAGRKQADSVTAK